MKFQRAVWALILLSIWTSITFTCFTGCKKDNDKNPDSNVIKDSDGNIYSTDTIGTQIWLVENLMTTHYRNGDPITGGDIKISVKNTTGEGAYWNYNNDPNLAAVYGRLYNWYALADGREIAPEGFHVASDEEWLFMMESLGGDLIAGGKLKEAGTSHWNAPNEGATNESGFTGLPSGSWAALYGNFTGLGDYASFWTSTESNTYSAWGRSMNNTSATLYRGETNKEYGFAVRCIKNK